jgi:hypothetical protein
MTRKRIEKMIQLKKLFEQSTKELKAILKQLEAELKSV